MNKATFERRMTELSEKLVQFEREMAESGAIAPKSYGHGYDSGRSDAMLEAIRILHGYQD